MAPVGVRRGQTGAAGVIGLAGRGLYAGSRKPTSENSSFHAGPYAGAGAYPLGQHQLQIQNGLGKTGSES